MTAILSMLACGSQRSLRLGIPGGRQPSTSASMTAVTSIKLIEPYQAELIQTVEESLAMTLPELAARLLDKHEVVAAPAMLSRILCWRGVTYKNT
jgi:hypothetical protein